MHYPTDVSLLWDAVRCLLRPTGLTAEQYAVRGWRQWRHLSREVKKLVRTGCARRGERSGIRSGWRRMWSAAGRWWSEQRQRSTCCGARAWGNWAVAPFQASSLTPGGRLTKCGVRLRGETIPHARRRSFPFSRNTRVGFPKARRARRSNSGSPVAIIEDQYGFILHHKVLWEGEDVDVAVSMVQEAQALYPELRACSFDRGFHSRDNRVRLDALLDVNALPGRGYLSRADREREEEESFVAARRAHPAIESAINGLEHRGLDRVRSHGADGFARTVALSVLAANLHRIGLILQKRERKRQRLVA